MEENKAIEGGNTAKSFSQLNFFEKIVYMVKSVGGTMVYPNVLLFQLIKSKSVSTKQKLVIFAAFLYLISPVDLISELVVWGFGFADDMVAVIAAITALLSCFTDEVQADAKAFIKRALGNFDDRGIEALSKIIQAANRAVNFKKTVVKKEPAQQPAQQTAQEKKIEIVDVEEVKPIEAGKA